MTEKSLEGRIALITGASAGIGEQCARDFASMGASVVVNARRAEKIDALVNEIAQYGGKAFAVAGDCVEASTIDAMYDACVAQFGGEPDLVLVNAGRGLRGSPLNSDPDEWEGILRLNVLGATRLIRRAALSMKGLCADPTESDAWLEKPRDIVVISSSVGKNISPFSSMYGSTKFAIASIAEAVRRELAPTGIRVANVCPAIVRTEFQESAKYEMEGFGQFMETIAPVLTAHDIARLIAFIVSQPAHMCVNDVMVRPVRQEYP
ncbi:MAG: SDR family oxidoreductase [Phycisphaerales bacterium]